MFVYYVVWYESFLKVFWLFVYGIHKRNKILFVNIEVRDHWRTRCRWGEILKFILVKLDMKEWTVLNWLRAWDTGGLVSTWWCIVCLCKKGQYFKDLSERKLSKKTSYHWASQSFLSYIMKSVYFKSKEVENAESLLI